MAEYSFRFLTHYPVRQITAVALKLERNHRKTEILYRVGQEQMQEKIITPATISIWKYQIIIGEAGIFDELRPMAYCLNEPLCFQRAWKKK